ncbi:UDP-N-acetylglucosamine--N-acetylmuramyl-(pentapeptide) pyrophosphoryl-undecaprenol N-acetylglucosamine transferase [Pelagibacteraceae bacterium]|nr:UDP-N-acetylglucosamine--N-acetylmuramyl-(pentapeptide) pyrophosphoryl-undecaprenol N-acetylglucosamine transferase [Pelagibacteraceae bacterium]
MKKKILISTGGSGGHIIPGTIFYEHLRDKFDISMISDLRGLRFLNKDKYNVEIINVAKISRNIFLTPLKILSIFFSVLKALFYIKKNKIEIIISTGGYMSLPICLASKILNIKLFLFEPNMVLGRSNKFFINNCNKIFCYSDKIKNFPNKLRHKISIIPALLRKEFYNIRQTNHNGKNVNLLIIGGSQGAKLFDTVIQNSIIKLSKKYTLKVYHQTSKNNFQTLKLFYKEKKIDNELFDFNEDVSFFMNKASICITRAGATTLAELVFLNVPHITIPLTTAKDNHQFENAFFYNQLGCNWILNQSEIKDDSITSRLFNIINDKEEYLNKKKNMKNFSYQNTWNTINQQIISTINEN